MIRRRRPRGGSVLEMAFFMPWYIFLFIGAFDWGFYARALISTENAARVAAHYTSTDNTTAADQATACTLALEELRIAANVPTVSACDTLPVIVTARAVTGADGQPASEVDVTYQTQKLIPIPLLLQGQATLYRTAQMRLVKSN